MKPGQIVYSKVNLQPLKVGDRGVVQSVNFNHAYPIRVKWDKLHHSLPMKVGELK